MKVRDLLGSDNAVEAIRIAIPAAKQFPHGIDIHRLMGIAYLNQLDYFNAQRAFDIALEGDPGDLVAQVGVAEVEEAIEGPAVALRAWRRAWEIEPGNETIAGRLREVQRRAASEGQTAAYGIEGRIDGPIPHTHASIVRTHLRSGLFEHAMLEAVTALTQDKSRTDLQLLLAEAWWRSGETEIAHSIAASILEKFPFCVVANLLVALHRRVVSRDPRQQIERTREADPFDRIASSLFMGRDIPPLFDDQPVNGSWSTVRSSTGFWPVVMGNSQARQGAAASDQAPSEPLATDRTANMTLPAPQIEKLPKQGEHAPVSPESVVGNGKTPAITEVPKAAEGSPLASKPVLEAGSAPHPIQEVPALPAPGPEQAGPAPRSDPAMAAATSVAGPLSETPETEASGHEDHTPSLGLVTPVDSTEASDLVGQTATSAVHELAAIDLTPANSPTEEVVPSLSAVEKAPELDDAPANATLAPEITDKNRPAPSVDTIAPPQAATSGIPSENPSNDASPDSISPETAAAADADHPETSSVLDPVAESATETVQVEPTVAVLKPVLETTKYVETSDFEALTVAELRDAGERASQQRNFTEAIRLYSKAISRIRAGGNQGRR